ncbi:MAG: hypothetical protein LUQ35_06330 [Methanoregula sp.]|nr:hypothetical protein [Methanoregula sp.]
MTDYYKYSDEIPDRRLIERLLAGYPDAGQLIAIITRSYDYIQKLPLKGLSENYYRENPELFDLVP